MAALGRHCIYWLISATVGFGETGVKSFLTYGLSGAGHQDSILIFYHVQESWFLGKR